jgi:hypothetical protein
MTAAVPEPARRRRGCFSIHARDLAGEERMKERKAERSAAGRLARESAWREEDGLVGGERAGDVEAFGAEA